MHAASIGGLKGIIALLPLLGGLGLPLGIPPSPEDPLMGRVAPQKCVFYTTWSGMAAPDPASTNHTEQLLAEPEIQYMIAQIEQQITAGLRNAAGREEPEAAAIVDDASKWVKRLLTQPAAVFVSRAKLGPEGPDVHAGALVKVGDDIAQLKATLQKYQNAFLREAVEPVTIGGDTWHRIKLGPKAPEITWGTRHQYLLIGVGEGAIEGMVSRAATPPPKWLAEVRSQLPVDRPATVTYINVATLLETFAPLGGPQVAPALEATGLGNVRSLASVTGLDKEGVVNRSLLGLEGEPQGLLAALLAESLTADDLAPIPRDATIAMAAKLDAEGIFQSLLAVLEKVQPEAKEELLDGVAEMEEELDIKLRDDLLRALGKTVRVYNSPGEGGLVITGLTLVADVADRRRLAATQDKLLALVKAEFDKDDYGPRIEEFEFAGEKVYMFNARDDEFPVAPSWCLTEDKLIAATFPQNVKAYLSRGDDFESLSAVPQVASLLGSGDGAIMLTYYDAQKLFELVYPLIPAVAQVAMAEISEEGIDINVSILPSAAAIGKHLRPGVGAVRRTDAGIEAIGRQTLPAGNVGAVVPMAVAVLAPAVGSARGSARRVQSMNNLKQIALGVLNYELTHGSFPPAYTTDDAGKPLLSWRVLILPYIEEKPLYDEFKLDEPWDSDHNKQLIELMPQVFKPAGSQAPPGKTNYQTVRGRKTAFPGKEKISLADVPDGSSNTIMAVQTSDASAVTWTKPNDFEYDEDDPLSGLVGMGKDGFNAVFCDGHVEFLPDVLDPDELIQMFNRDDGKSVEPKKTIEPEDSDDAFE